MDFFRSKSCGQIVTSSPRHCTCSQFNEHPVVYDREEYLEQCHYTPELFSFPLAQEVIKRTHFEGLEAMKRAVTSEVSGRFETPFYQSTVICLKRMEICIRLNGFTFKGKPCMLFEIDINCL